MKRFLTGIKPTGYAHIGNYFTAIQPSVELSKNKEAEGFYFIADYHALTTLKTKQEMEEYTYSLAATWLACGLDPQNCVFFRQSDVPEVFELNWILCNVTPKGLLNRAHAYKAIVEKNNAEGQDIDSGVNMGIYNYPILMAADILAFESDFVPIGLDQKQHIEITRDIATYFNNKYGQTFKLPYELMQKEVTTLVGLDGRKMSKSYDNIIQIFTPENQLKKTINKIVTDSKLPGEPKDPDCTINKIYKLFATKQEAEKFEKSLIQGLGWGEAKKQLFELMNSYLGPMREKYDYFMKNKYIIDDMFIAGAEKARKVAQKTLQKVRKSVGV